MESHKEAIEQAGLQVIAVGLAAPKHARHYCGKLAPSVQCLSNEAHDLYQACGLGRGNLLQLVGPEAFVATWRASARGFTWDGKLIGDFTMLPGTFLVDRAGVVRYAYYSRHAGDHPDLSAVIAAGQGLQAQPEREAVE